HAGCRYSSIRRSTLQATRPVGRRVGDSRLAQAETLDRRGALLPADTPPPRRPALSLCCCRRRRRPCGSRLLSLDPGSCYLLASLLVWICNTASDSCSPPASTPTPAPCPGAAQAA